MTEFELEAAPREPRGKGGARQVRREGNVPAVIYGVTEPRSVQVSEPEASRLVHHLHGTSQLVTLRLTGGKSKKGEEVQVLIKEVQTTPVGGRLLHIDFNEIASDHKVRVGVEVRPQGTPEGVILGGTMQIVMHEIPVECLPKDLPDGIDVDVSALLIGKSLHIGDVHFPPGVSPLAEDDAAVIVISGRMKEEEEEVAAEEVEGEEGLEGEEGVAAEEGEEAAPDREEPAE